jgi:serine/threonine protein kinase
VDWYALGVTLFEMVSGVSCYPKWDASGTHVTNFPRHLSRAAKALVYGLLEQDPKKRYESC